MKISNITNLTVHTLLLEGLLLALSSFLEYRQISGDFISFLFALGGIGIILSFFMVLVWVFAQITINEEA